MTITMGRKITVVAAAAVVLAGLLATTGGVADAGEGARAILRNQEGVEVGVVKFSQEDGFVQVKANAAFPGGLAPGFKGFHIHAGAECVAPFTTAAGHLGHDGTDPASTPHSTHEGDMPVLLVNADGTAFARFLTDRVAIGDIVGRTVIVHAGPDNYGNVTRYGTPDAATLGTGDAGARYACGVIQ
ncbi:MAG TPA: superoxide dismutase family protein [Actinomycetota bacterium]